jgi:hypothetical protein
MSALREPIAAISLAAVLATPFPKTSLVGELKVNMNRSMKIIVAFLLWQVYSSTSTILTGGTNEKESICPFRASFSSGAWCAELHHR